MKQKNKKETLDIYEIDNKKYTVISKCMENPNSNEKLYDVLGEFVIAKLNSSVDNKNI